MFWVKISDDIFCYKTARSGSALDKSCGVINVVFTVAIYYSLLMQIAAMYLIGIVCGRFFVKK